MVRPLKDIDEEKVAELAFKGASDRMIGDILGLDHANIERRFAPIIRKKRAERRLKILEGQNAVADELNVTMLIWLGKQELDQADKVVQANTDPEGMKRINVPDSDPRHEGKG